MLRFLAKRRNFINALNGMSRNCSFCLDIFQQYCFFDFVDFLEFSIRLFSVRCLAEDSILLQSLGRDSRPIVATVDTIFKSDLDVKAEIQRR